MEKMQSSCLCPPCPLSACGCVLVSQTAFNLMTIWAAANCQGASLHHWHGPAACSRQPLPPLPGVLGCPAETSPRGSRDLTLLGAQLASSSQKRKLLSSRKQTPLYWLAHRCNEELLMGNAYHNSTLGRRVSRNLAGNLLCRLACDQDIVRQASKEGKLAPRFHFCGCSWVSLVRCSCGCLNTGEAALSPFASLLVPRSRRCPQQCLSISVSYLLIKLEALKSPVWLNPYWSQIQEPWCEGILDFQLLFNNFWLQKL